MTPESAMPMSPGGDQSAPQPQAGGAPGADSAMQTNGQIRQLIMQVGQLAQQMPEAQQELTAAAKALTAASLKLISSQREPQGGPMPLGS